MLGWQSLSVALKGCYICCYQGSSRILVGRMCLLELLGLQTTQHCLIQSSACPAIFYFSGNVSHRFGIGKFLYKTKWVISRLCTFRSVRTNCILHWRKIFGVVDGICLVDSYTGISVSYNFSTVDAYVLVRVTMSSWTAYMLFFLSLVLLELSIYRKSRSLILLWNNFLYSCLCFGNDRNLAALFCDTLDSKLK
jgi:hypothetical protein